MRLQREDWHALHHLMWLMGIAALVVVLLVGVAYQYNRNQTLALQQIRTSHNKAQQELQLAQQEQADFLQYLPKYQRLVDDGFIGEERRQQWLAQLRKIREQHALFEIDYDISEQQPYQPSFIEIPDTQLYRSVMTVKLGLLHVGDLFHLLAGLRQHTSPFMVRDCEVLRSVDMMGKSDTLPKNLQARCEIDWLTLKQIDVKEAL